MQRIFGALAVFGGWLCIPLAGLSGLITTEWMGLSHTEGALPPQSLYGIPAILVMWLLVAVALVSLLPVAMAIVAPDPSRRVYAAAPEDFTRQLTRHAAGWTTRQLKDPGQVWRRGWSRQGAATVDLSRRSMAKADVPSAVGATTP